MSTLQLALIAIVVVLLWLFGFSDPCLGTEISNSFTAHDPPAITPEIGAAPDGTVVVENPYGITACDYWPTTANHVTSASVLAILLLAVGWFAARRIPHRPYLATAGVTVFALVFALALQFFSRFDRELYYLSQSDSDAILLEVLLALGVIAVGTGVAMSGAWLSQVIGRRA